MPPIRLSDAELSAIMVAERPIAPERRDAFLQQIASTLSSCAEIGPGAVQLLAPRNPSAPNHRLGVGSVHDSGRGKLALHPHDPNLGTLEPHPPSLVVHARSGSTRRPPGAPAQCRGSSFGDDLDFYPGACRHRPVHAGARADHEQGGVRRLTSAAGESAR